jgi:predicted alpha/beta-hydrolase family hydrolase
VIERQSKFEEIKIPLREPVHGLTAVSGVLGTPAWWPTGARVAVAIAHGSNGRYDEPLIEFIHRELTERKLLTLRFNFPFAEAGRRASADSPEVLEATFRAAIAALGRDPAAAPAHLFLGGMGLGAKIAAQMAASTLRVDGLFFVGYPLHPQDQPQKADAEHLYRIISPMLFVQGLRDRTCDVAALRTTLKRVGAPTRLHLVEEADSNFRVTKKSGIDAAAVRAAVLDSLAGWVQSRLDTA